MLGLYKNANKDFCYYVYANIFCIIIFKVQINKRLTKVTITFVLKFYFISYNYFI